MRVTTNTGLKSLAPASAGGSGASSSNTLSALVSAKLGAVAADSESSREERINALRVEIQACRMQVARTRTKIASALEEVLPAPDTSASRAETPDSRPSEGSSSVAALPDDQSSRSERQTSSSLASVAGKLKQFFSSVGRVLLGIVCWIRDLLRSLFRRSA